MSPFAFCGDKPKPKKREDKLSEIKWWERETREKKNFIFCHTVFFLLPGGRIGYRVSQELPADINQSW